MRSYERYGWGEFRRRRSPSGAESDRRRHGGDPLHIRQHRSAEGRGALAPQPAGRLPERQPVPRQPRGRRHPRGTAAQLRRWVQPAHDRVRGRCTRRTRQLPAAGRRGPAVRQARGDRAHLRTAAVDSARRADMASRGDDGHALLRQHRRANAECDAGQASRNLSAGPAVPDVWAHRSLPFDLPRPCGSRPSTRLDRQGNPQRRDPRRSR